MGVLDKIKNALFEVEYVEVEEPEKKEKKVKPKEKSTMVNDKPIAKKVVLPGKKDTKVESLEEEELKDYNFESRPIDETIKEKSHDSFKFIDDNDFRMDEEEYVHPEPEIVQVIEEDKKNFESRTRSSRNYDTEVNEDTYHEDNVVDHPDKLYNNKSYGKEHETKLYGVDSSYNVPVHEYGTYEHKEEKAYFRPSPIISPIYGILDKNYKKEDVVSKREVRISSSFTRSNVSVDEVRDKAYGGASREEEIKEVTDPKFEVEEDNDDNLLVDLSDSSDKPEVKEVTMGDALEYFQDLGLEYNVDYVDASKDKPIGKREKENYEDLLVDLADRREESNLYKKDAPKDIFDDEHILKDDDDEVEEKVNKKQNVVEIKNESKSNMIVDDDDDNLFDLIDSMYQDKE
jgi:hypothetical protein